MNSKPFKYPKTYIKNVINQFSIHKNPNYTSLNTFPSQIPLTKRNVCRRKAQKQQAHSLKARKLRDTCIVIKSGDLQLSVSRPILAAAATRWQHMCRTLLLLAIASPRHLRCRGLISDTCCLPWAHQVRAAFCSAEGCGTRFPRNREISARSSRYVC